MCGRSPRSVPSLLSHNWRPAPSAMFDDPMKMLLSLAGQRRVVLVHVAVVMAPRIRPADERLACARHSLSTVAS